MSDATENMPITPMYDELQIQPAVGWVVHVVEGKPQHLSNTTHWAWCKVEVDKPGYTEIVFTLPDGATTADPYPNGEQVRLGVVLFKVFC